MATVGMPATRLFSCPPVRASSFHAKMIMRCLMGVLAAVTAMCLISSEQILQIRHEEENKEENSEEVPAQHVEHRQAVTAQEEIAQKFGVDFIVAGFPKCGTSTLRSTFMEHEQVDFPHEEICQIDFPNKSMKDIAALVAKTFSSKHANHSTTTSTATTQQQQQQHRFRGLKCPASILHMLGIKRLEALNPATRIIIGVRHPIQLFQSYYNYRVSHRKKVKDKRIPDPYELIGGRNKGWWGVYTDLMKYDLYLKQLGKVPLSSQEIKEMQRMKLKPTHTGLFVFIYDVEQMSDLDEERALEFRTSLRQFLGLTKPIVELGHHNALPNKTYPETIDLCMEKYDELRRILIENAVETSRWIREVFMKSPDVVIGGGDDGDYFRTLVSKWEEDPCSLDSQT